MTAWNETDRRDPALGDPVLRDVIARLNPKPLSWKVVRTEWLLCALNREKLGLSRIVTLECGHYEVTRNLDRARCSTCSAMQRNGEDLEGFLSERGLGL